jgi:hypothetical protein
MWSERTDVYISGNLHPQFYDADYDGLVDLFVCDKGGSVVYYRNYGTASAPSYVEEPTRNPLAVIEVLGVPRLLLVDTNGDSKKDAIVTSVLGAIKYYRNLGISNVPSFVEITGTANVFSNVNIGMEPCFDLLDVNNDGLKDLIVGTSISGTIRYYKNTGTLSSASFTLQSGASNPWEGKNFGTYVCPKFFDVDR